YVICTLANPVFVFGKDDDLLQQKTSPEERNETRESRVPVVESWVIYDVGSDTVYVPKNGFVNEQTNKTAQPETGR
ncbi:MAG: hypothetical protein WCL27_17880, partial [Betaproteobacteria bacterium]